MAGLRRLTRAVIAIPPPAFLALSYAALILLGTLALMLPAMQARPFGAGDALFTAVSAVPVTGLGVIDTAADLSRAGQLLLLVLVQLGGLGLMTVSVLVLGALGLPVGLRAHSFLREDLNQTSIGELLSLTRVILRVVLLCEAVGTLGLALVFVPEYGTAEGLWHAFFHAVSAFNNAGVSSLPGGLVPWVGDPVVNLTIPALVVIGGLGYGVLVEVVAGRRWARLSLHTKLMLAGTGVLLAGSFLLFAALEWQNPRTLGGLGSVGARLLASWFQAVTPRSAGFNTLDMAALRDGTATLFLALMLIGGGPTSTASGIKVTTVIVLLLATAAFFRRQTELSAFGRSIGLDEVLKVSALTAISVAVVFSGVFLLTLGHEGRFLDVAFEVTSAFGTAGLTRGITAELGDYGRTVMMALMFIGRVGPLTLGFFIATQATPRVRYPPGQVILG